jgi:hypothetical protein
MCFVRRATPSVFIFSALAPVIATIKFSSWVWLLCFMEQGKWGPEKEVACPKSLSHWRPNRNLSLSHFDFVTSHNWVCSVWPDHLLTHFLHPGEKEAPQDPKERQQSHNVARELDLSWWEWVCGVLLPQSPLGSFFQWCTLTSSLPHGQSFP